MLGDRRPIPRHHYTPSHLPIHIQRPFLSTSNTGMIDIDTSKAYTKSMILELESSNELSPTSAAIEINKELMIDSAVQKSIISTSPLTASIQFDHVHSHHLSHYHHSKTTLNHHHHHHHHHNCINHFLPTTTSSPSGLHSSHIRRSFWNVKCNCLFSLLPDELLIFNIFSFLPASTLVILQGVCRRWQFLATDRVLWPSLDLSSHTNINSFQFDSLISKVGSSLQTLKLCHCNNIALDSLLSISAPLLEELHLCNVRLLQDEHVEAVVLKFPNLRHLSLYNCVLLSDRSIRFLFNPVHPSLPKNYQLPLIELSIRGCSKLTDRAFENVSSTLQGLNISGCKQLTALTFSHIARNCTQLVRLNAHGIPQISDAAIDAISKSSYICNSLSTLHISSPNPFGGNPHITDASLTSLSNMKALTCVNLQGCANMTDAGFVKFVSNCRQLTRLNIGGCYRLSDESVYALAQSNFGTPTLTHLSLFQCVHITTKSIIYLLETVPSIQHIDLHSCVQMDSSLIHILKQRTHGKRLSYDDHLDLMFSDLSLSPSQHSLISTSQEHEFIAPALRSLDIGSCRSISPDDVKELSLIRPSVRIIHY